MDGRWGRSTIRVLPPLRVLVAAGALLGVAVGLPRLPAAAEKQQTASPVASENLADIRVSFRVDPRLTRSRYMGDRWVSPPTFTVVKVGREATVDVRAQGIGVMGASLRISPEWIPDDPELVAVKPARGTRVKLTAKREGRSTLEVRSSGVSLVLLIETRYKDGSTWAHITPVTVPPRKP